MQIKHVALLQHGGPFLRRWIFTLSQRERDGVRANGMRLMPVVFLLALLLGGCQGLRIPDAQKLETGAWPVSGGTAERVNAAEAAVPATLVPAWTYNAEAGFGPSSPLVAGDVVLVGTRRGDLHAIQLSDGRRIGYVSVGGSVEGAMAVAGSALFGATADGKRPLFRYSLKDGRVAWRVASGPILSGVLLVEDAVIAADATGKVSAYDAATGDTRWEHVPGEPAAVRAAPVITPAGIFIADDHGALRMLDAQTGALVWAGQGGRWRLQHARRQE